MKKKPLLLLIMRISVLQFSLILSLMGTALAFDGKSQNLLNKKITLNQSNVRLDSMLSVIEHLSNINIVYKAGLARTEQRASIQVRDIELSEVLKQVLSPYGLIYEMSDNYLVIRKGGEETSALVQDLTVKGTVKDKNGEPMPGVSVKVKGTVLGAMTNQEGQFTIRVPQKESILVFSYIGYISQEIKADQSSLNVVMAEQLSKLNEVVVVGYGSQVKKKLSTSISSIKGADIGEMPVATLGDALAGKAAGVDVSSAFGGTPGESPNIVIRGLGSLGSDNSPLYVVDGYPLESSENFARINPADIESIDILKDAASASIYGSRASNGVVIVTTKRGVSGQTRFNLSAYTGFQQLAHKIELMNADQYREFAPLLAKERSVNNNSNILQSDQLGSSDWQDAIFRNAMMSQFNLSASGGNEKARFNISANYLNQQGIEIRSGFKSYGLRFNLDANLSAKLKIGISLAPNYSQQDRDPLGGNFDKTNDNAYGSANPPNSPIYAALVMPPVIPVMLADGRYGQANFLTGNDLFTTNLLNPVAVLNSIKNYNPNFTGVSNGYLEWSILKDLKFKVNAGATLASNRREVYVSSITPTAAFPLASAQNPNPNGIYAADMNGRSIGWLIENTLTYTKSIKKHNFTVFALQSGQKYDANTTNVFGTTGSYTTDLIQNPAASAQRDGGVSYDRYTFSSLAARVNYDYNEKYLFSASIRRDGSSKFGANHKFGTFRSISAGWRLSEEDFIKKIRWISELKLRASYGESGNANIGSFTWINSIQNSNYNFGGTRALGSVTSGYYNPDLTWEKNKQVDLGLEIGVLKDRLYLTADVYRKVTTDMIMNKSLAGIVGYASNYNTNTGRMVNKGLELALNSVNFTGRSFSWKTDFNISFNRNKVIDLGGADNLGYKGVAVGWSTAYLIKVGRPIGDMYGFIVDGVIKNADEANAAPKYRSGTVKPGDMKFQDANGDGFIDDKDKVIIGSGLPDYVAGMTNRFGYKGFDLSILVQARQGGNIINGNLRNTYSAGMNMPSQFYNNMYLKTNPEADVKYPSVASTAPYQFANTLTTLVVEDASFVRVRNITLGYTFKRTLLNKIKLNSARFYLSAQNPLTFTKYTGYNPEVSSGNQVNTPGFDQGTYPATRTFTLGLNVGF